MASVEQLLSMIHPKLETWCDTAVALCAFVQGTAFACVAANVVILAKWSELDTVVYHMYLLHAAYYGACALLAGIVMCAPGAVWKKTGGCCRPCVRTLLAAARYTWLLDSVVAFVVTVYVVFWRDRAVTPLSMVVMSVEGVKLLTAAVITVARMKALAALNKKNYKPPPALPTTDLHARLSKIVADFEQKKRADATSEFQAPLLAAAKDDVVV